MGSFSAVIDAFGGPAKFGRALGIPASHAGVMKHRESIPAEYWPAVVKAASEKGIDGVTFEGLALLAATKPESVEAAE